MEYNTIIAVRRKRPEVLSGEDAFICDNENYTLTFQFDDEWTEHATKTVLFVMPGGKCVAVLMEGDSCRVPRVTRPGTLYIGVKAGSVLKTTAPIEIPVNRSAQTLCGGYSATIPPDLAQQIIERMDEQEAANAETVERLSKEKLDKQQGIENAGKLMFVGENGEIIPLALGAGLTIKDGVLMIVNAVVTAAICGRFKCGEVVCGGTK
jgi:hypothetical protein